MPVIQGISPVSVSLVAVAIFVLYRLIVFPAFVSPLSKIPNAHWSSSFSPIWILWVRSKSKENVTVHDAHQRHGSVVRLGPSEISVNCVKNGIHTIYSGGFEKHRWYANIFSNYGYVSRKLIRGYLFNEVRQSRQHVLHEWEQTPLSKEKNDFQCVFQVVHPELIYDAGDIKLHSL
jgi:hypothetical protein